jgi:hypothetical protein
LVVTSLESKERVRAYQRTGNYNINFLVDPGGEVLNKFEVQTLPLHFFVKRNLEVAEIVVGVLSKEDLQKALLKL